MVDVTVVHPDGRRERVRQVAPIQNKREAERYERELRVSLLDGTRAAREKTECPRFTDFAMRFMDTYARTNNKRSEIETKEVILRVHLTPTFGQLTTDTRHPVLMAEGDPMSLRDFFGGTVLLHTGRFGPLGVGLRDWLAPRPVGYSDDCLPRDSLLSPLDWSKPYVYYGVTDFEGDGGLVKLLGMSFDDHVESGDRRWYLVAIAVWAEWPPDEAR